jgi:Protein of unknown function (DUF2924)
VLIWVNVTVSAELTASTSVAACLLQAPQSTVMMREHRGVRHTVTVIPDGFVWQDRSYPSLSAVARADTARAEAGQ